MTKPKLTIERLGQLKACVDQIHETDQTIEWIARDLEKSAQGWGRHVREIFGLNRLWQFRNETLGSIVAVAIINMLLEERANRVEDVDGQVEIGPPPCKKQCVPLDEAN